MNFKLSFITFVEKFKLFFNFLVRKVFLEKLLFSIFSSFFLCFPLSLATQTASKAKTQERAHFYVFKARPTQKFTESWKELSDKTIEPSPQKKRIKAPFGTNFSADFF